MAGTYTWVDWTGGPYAWNSAANWDYNGAAASTFPSGQDVAVQFANTLHQDSSITIDLNTAITVGSLTVQNGDPGYGSHGAQYLIVGNGGSLNFSVSTGTALLEEQQDDVYGTGAWTISAPITFTSNTNVDTASVVPGGYSFYNGNGAFAGGIAFNSATTISGAGSLIKTGPSAFGDSQPPTPPTPARSTSSRGI